MFTCCHDVFTMSIVTFYLAIFFQLYFQVCDETTYADAFSLYRLVAKTTAVNKVDSDCTEDFITIDGNIKMLRSTFKLNEM